MYTYFEQSKIIQQGSFPSQKLDNFIPPRQSHSTSTPKKGNKKDYLLICPEVLERTKKSRKVYDDSGMAGVFY